MAPSVVFVDDIASTLALQPDETATVARRLLVDCSVCGFTHPPGTDTDPACTP